jgi:hypothetical protein
MSTLRQSTVHPVPPFNQRNKSREDLCAIFGVHIDLAENKNLCAFLEAYEPFAKELQPPTTEPYLICTRTGQPMSSSALSSRCHHVWKTRLEPKLGFYGAGCNVARRAAVDTARRTHGKRKMTQAEIQEETEQCRARGHTRSVAERIY